MGAFGASIDGECVPLTGADGLAHDFPPVSVYDPTRLPL